MSAAQHHPYVASSTTLGRLPARDLARKADGKQQARLSAAVAEVAGLAAWLHADMAEPTRARQVYKMSIGAAHQAHHALLAIYMQGSFGQYATTVGDPAQGLRLLRDASARLPRSAPNTAGPGWLAWRRSPSATSVTGTR
jgi:hypothetical protein